MDYTERMEILEELKKITEKVDKLSEKTPEEKRAEIMAIRDTPTRLKAISDNIELFDNMRHGRR